MVATWDTLLPQVVHAINTRVIRAHGYTPSQLLFGFNLRQTEMDATARDIIVSGMVENSGSALIRTSEEVPNASIGKGGEEGMNALDSKSCSEIWSYHVRMAKIEEMRERVRCRMLERGIPTRPGRFWETPKEHDMVLLRRFEIDKQHGRKFEPRWEGAYELTDISWHGRTGRLVNLVTKQRVRTRKGGLQEKVHLDDLKVFIPREEKWIGYDTDRMDPETGRIRFIGLVEAVEKTEEWELGRREFDMRAWGGQERS